MKSLQTSFVYAVLSLLLGTSITGFLSCAHREQPVLQRADELLSTDSAERAAALLDSVQKEVATWNKADRMRHALLSAEAQNKRFIPFTDDSLLLAVVDYYEKEGTPFDQMRAYYVMGSVYRDLQWSTQAQKYYHKAIEKADTTAHTHLLLMIKNYAQLGELYWQVSDYENALEMFRKESHYSFAVKDSVMAFYSMLWQSNCFREKGIIDSTLSINNRCFNYFRHKGMLNEAGGALLSNAFLCLDNNLLKETEHYIKCFEDSMGIVTDGSLKILKHELNQESYYIAKGKLLYKKKEYPSALTYFYKAYFSDNPIYNTKGKLHLMNTYRKMKIKDSIIKYQKEYIKSLVNNKKNDNFQILKQVQSHREISQERDRIYINHVRAQNKIYIISFCLILAGIIIILLLKYLNNRKKQFKEEQNKILSELHSQIVEKNNIKNLLLQKQELINLMIQQKAILEQKSFEETSKLQTEIENLQQQIQAYDYNIATIENKIKEIYNANPNNKFLLQEKSAEMHQIASNNKTPKENDWKQLDLAFLYCDKSFYTFMTNIGTKLNEKEKRVCYLTRLKFPSKEIEVLLTASQPNISNICSRIYQKLFSKKGTAKEFRQIIQNIE